MSDESASKVKVAVSLEYCHLMSEKNKKSLCLQLELCISANKHSEHPIQLYFTGFKGEIKDFMEMKCVPYSKWDVNLVEQSYFEFFEKDSILFLTPDSPNVIEGEINFKIVNYKEFDESKVYIIGGLVDSSIIKGVTYKEAVENGISHAKLPISKYAKLGMTSVLTINQGNRLLNKNKPSKVFEIISQIVNESTDWDSVIKNVVPKRKIREYVKKDSHSN